MTPPHHCVYILTTHHAPWTSYIVMVDSTAFANDLSTRFTNSQGMTEAIPLAFQIQAHNTVQLQICPATNVHLPTATNTL